MKINVGVSNHHVHLKQDDFDILFGINNKLIKKNDLNQPHNFASTSTVDLVTNKGIIKNVRVLGEIRNYTQVEISKTDSYILGINPPVRASGHLDNSEEVTIVGPVGKITLKCCILADRHIHITKELQEKYGLNDTVSIKIGGEKGGILDDVHLKFSDDAFFELHIDTDEANAFLLESGDEVEIIN